MRIYILTFFTLSLCLISYNVFTNSGGPTDGVAGEPPLNETCALSGCHSGSAVNSGGGTATILFKDSVGNIVTSYDPNHTYTITLSITENAKTRYGFQAIILKSIGTGTNVIGTMIVTNAIRTQLFGTGFRKSMMHTKYGIDSTINLGSWSFNWKAPASNNGTATIYAAFNATNDDQNSSGDKIYTKTLAITGNGTFVGIDNKTNTNVHHIYPNPATTSLNIDLTSKAIITILNLEGKVIYSGVFDSTGSKINIEQLTAGVYIAQVVTENNLETFKFIKQ